MTDRLLPSGTYRGRIEWIDTDAAGIYHNATVVRFVEAAEASLMRDRGLDGYFPAAPRVRYEATFEAPLRFGQEVTAVVTLTRLGTTSMTFDFEVFGEPVGRGERVRAAHGRYVTVHVGGPAAHRDGAASVPWPAEWVAALSQP